MLNAFNELPESVRTSIAALVILGAGAKAASLAMKLLGGASAAAAGGLRTVPVAAGAAAAGMTKATVAANGLAVAMRRIPVVAAAAWGAGNLFELYEVDKEMSRLTQSVEERNNALQSVVESTKAYQNVQIEATATAANMFKEERQIYVGRLRAAAEYYRARTEIISRADMERDGPAAPVSSEALAAAKQSRLYRSAIDDIENELKRRGEAEEVWAGRVATIKATELGNIQKNLDAQQKAYDKANENLETAQKRRIQIEKRFADLVKSFQGGGAGEEKNDYRSMSDARIEARKALAGGDTEKAIEQAERAAKILEEMRRAGENTYGFAGIAAELGQIATEAAKLDETNAAEAVQVQEDRIKDLMKQAEALNRVSVGFESDAESEEQTKQRLIKLAQEWAKYMQVPVTFTMPDGSTVRAPGGQEPAAPGFAEGGWTGPGGKYQFGGIVHRDEYVQPKRVMKQPGARQFMDLFRKHGMSMFQGYAEGGLVGGASVPDLGLRGTSLPTAAGGAGKDLGTVNLYMADGEHYPMQAQEDVIRRLYNASRNRRLRGR